MPTIYLQADCYYLVYILGNIKLQLLSLHYFFDLDIMDKRYVCSLKKINDQVDDPGEKTDG